MPFNSCFKRATYIVAMSVVVFGSSCNGPAGNGPSSTDGSGEADTTRYRKLCEHVRLIHRTYPDSAWDLLKEAESTASAIGGDSMRYDVEDLHFEVLNAKHDSSAVAYMLGRIHDRELSGEVEALMHARMNLGLNRLQSGDLPMADLLFRSALVSARELHDTLNEAQSGWLLMNVMNMSGRPDSAIALARPILRLPLNSRARPVIEMVRLDLAIAYMSAGEPDSAAAMFRQVLASEWIMKNPMLEQAVEVNYAELKTGEGDFKGALDLLLSAKPKAEATGDTLQLALLQLNLGNVYAALFRAEEAQFAFEQARVLARQVGMKDVEGTAIGSKALLALRKGESGGRDHKEVPIASLAGMLDQFEGAHAIALRTDNRRFGDLFLAGIGRVHALRGERDSARAMLDRAIAAARVRDDRSVLKEALRWSGELYMSAGAMANAEEQYHEALVLCLKIDALPDRILLLERLATIHERKGESAKALAEMREAKALQLAVFSDSTMNGIARIEARATYQRRQLADSLAHVQQIALERTEAQARIDRQRNSTIVAAAIGASLLLGGAIAFTLDRKRRIAQYQRRAAELEKDAAKFETQALRSQMNPHFIFNALNSISGYIQSNDPDQAQTFLARFAKLMRAVLENSRYAEVPLAKDLEVLRAYMELERTRAQGKFDFSITVDPSLDPNEVMVPPLLAQPFVENAIWHGIAGKSGQGHILLKVAQASGQLVITVEDDGIGRHANKSAVAKNKTSLGTAITRARLDLVEKHKGGSAGFRFVEIPMGTRVEIHLPLAA